MKRNSILDKIRSLRSKYVDIFIDNSFDLSGRIQYLMDLKGYDQKTLSQKLNKKESEISKWLSGSHNFTIKTLAKIEDVLEAKLFVVCDDSMRNEKEIVIMINDCYYKQDNDTAIKRNHGIKSYREKSPQGRVLSLN